MVFQTQQGSSGLLHQSPAPDYQDMHIKKALVEVSYELNVKVTIKHILNFYVMFNVCFLTNIFK